MLSTIRNRTGSFVVKGLLVLLIISFGAWGVNDMLGYNVGAGSSVAQVGSVEIPAQDLYDDVQREVARLRPMFGNRFTIEQARQLGVVEAVLNRRINTAATRAAAGDFGIAIGDGLVRQSIKAEPTFKGLAGNFDAGRFREVLQANGLTEAAYVANVRSDLEIGQYIGSLDSGIAAPKVMVDAVYRHRLEKRVVETILIADESVKSVAAPSDAELTKFHQDNAKRFTAPEYRRLTFVSLNADDLAKEISVSEEQLHEAYDARAAEFTTPETRKVRQMLLADQAKATQAAKQLAEGRDFAVVALEVAGQQAAGLDLGEVTRPDLLPELAAAVFDLKKPGVTKAVKSSLGWHLFEVSVINSGGSKKFETVKDALKRDVAREKAVDSLFDLSNRFEDQLGGGASLEEAAKALNLKIGRIDGIDRGGNGVDEKPVVGRPEGNQFLESAFATEEGSESALTENGEAGYFIVRVDGVTPPALRPLAAIRARVVEALTAERSADGAKQTAEKIVARLSAGTELAAIAAENTLTVETSDPVTRDDRRRTAGLTGELIGRIFDLQLGKAAMARVDGGYRIAVLKLITAADPATDKNGSKEIAGALSESMRADLGAQLTAALRQRLGVSIDRRVIETLFTRNR